MISAQDNSAADQDDKPPSDRLTTFAEINAETPFERIVTPSDTPSGNIHTSSATTLGSFLALGSVPNEQTNNGTLINATSVTVSLVFVEYNVTGSLSICYKCLHCLLL